MSKKMRLFLIVPAIAAAAGVATQASANIPVDDGVDATTTYPGTLYQEVGGGGYLCACGAKNCTPCS
jgi:hypothetical protein